MNKDALGHAVFDAYSGRPGVEFLERDDGYVKPGSKLTAEVYLSKPESWNKLERKGLSLVDGRILDIGCGAGRHALFLQAQGYSVDAFDISPLAIQVAKKQGLENAFVLDIENLGSIKNRYDTFLLLGNNLALLSNPKKGRKIITQLDQLANKGARVIATCAILNQDDPEHKSYQEENIRNNRSAGQLKLRVKYKDITGDWFEYWFLSSAELYALLKGTNWEIESYEEDQGQYLIVLKRN